MKYVKLFLGLNLVLFSACSSDDGTANMGNGWITANLNIDNEILSASIPQNETVNIDSISADDFKVSLKSADGAYSKTWERFADFPASGVYKVGDYIMEASYGSIDNEGFDSPYYYGRQTLTVSEAATTPVQIVCSLSNSMVTVSATEAFTGYFSDYSTTIHSDGGEYLQYTKNETRPIYVRPGNLSLTISVTKPDGQTASFTPNTDLVALPQHCYRIKLDVNNGEMGNAKLLISFDDSTETEEVVIDLSNDLMSSPAPEIFTNGFVSGQPLSVTEGTPAATKLAATISAGAGLSRVNFSSRMASIQDAGIPAELDLMSATDQQKAALEVLGLNVTGLWRNPDKMAEIDFTNFIANIHPAEGENAAISLIAIDRYGKSSQPVTLALDFNEVSLSTTEAADIIVGESTATMHIAPSTTDAQSAKLTLLGYISNRWVNLPIISIADNSNEWIITYQVPNGSGALPVKLLYNGVEKCQVNINRVAPRFSISVDPFASSAIVKINHSEPQVAAAIARQVEVTTTDGHKLHIVKRDITNGLVVISGLSQATGYSIKATALPGYSTPDYTEAVSFSTEKAQSIPNGDFEEAKLVDEYSNLPAGGRYSQTHVGIYNHQNYWSKDLYFPKGDWTSVNSKTMCKDAKNKNTWYQQLSTMIVNDCKNGSKAMKLTSVGWDANGGPIEDYAQKAGEYLPYNPNVPDIAFRAAGKLFLGSYDFSANDNTETYEEGISFNSRPSALTGYYKYIPAPGLPLDKGCVTIILYRDDNGVETIVSSKTAELTMAPDYTSFNIPLEYPVFGLRPTHLKLMFSSSAATGSIDYETANVPVANDLQASAVRGSSLWIDNISFAY